MMDESDQHPTRVTRAGEYVLGTLDADDRAAFESDLAANPESRRELAYWEQRLGAIGLSLAPVQPPAAVWARVSEKTFGALGQSVEPQASTNDDVGTDGNGPGFWRGLAIAASIAALVMAALLFVGTGSDEGNGAPAPEYASMVYDAPTGTSWLVTAGGDRDDLSVTAMGGYDVPEGKVLRAWLVPADGKPVALGEWPHTQGVHRLPVSKAAAGYMKKHASLMVSMEDAGANPSGGPAGRLMWTSPIAQRTG